MKDPVVINLAPDATPADVSDLFSDHEYGPHFTGCLQLEPSVEDRDELKFDEWFPLHVELRNDQVVVNYRVMFIGKESPVWSYADRQVVGIRKGDTLVFQPHG